MAKLEAVTPDNPLAGHLGWWFPSPFAGNARAHWSDGSGRSLCGKWQAIPVMTPADAFDADPEPAARECAACRRKLDKVRGASA